MDTHTMRSSKKLKANVSPHGWKKFICYYFTFAYGSREGEKKDKREGKRERRGRRKKLRLNLLSRFDR